jgi:hypothetical protein
VSETSFRGGARIGSVGGLFAKLTVSADRLALVASRDTYEFSPSQVVSVEHYGSIPLFARGIRIKHNRADYPEKIIFWCIGNRDSFFTDIGSNGFIPTGGPTERASGFPIRWTVVVAVIALWTALIMLDRWARPQALEPGPYSLLALLALFALVTAILASPRIQRMVLREGHQVGEIKVLLRLLQLAAGVLSVAFGAIWLASVNAG